MLVANIVILFENVFSLSLTLCWLSKASVSVLCCDVVYLLLLCMAILSYVHIYFVKSSVYISVEAQWVARLTRDRWIPVSPMSLSPLKAPVGS